MNPVVVEFLLLFDRANRLRLCLVKNIKLDQLLGPPIA